MAAYVLRPATLADRPAMADLWVASWVKTLPEIDFEARRPWLEAHLDSLAGGGALIQVAQAQGTDAQGTDAQGIDTQDGSVQGADAQRNAAQSGAAEKCPVAGFVVIHPGTGYLDQIAVSPAFWGAGAAEALMAEAKRIAPAGVTLDVNQENPRAVRFYEKVGLAITGEGENPMSGRRTFRMEWRP